MNHECHYSLPPRGQLQRCLNISMAACLVASFSACSSLPTGGADPLGLRKDVLSTSISDVSTDLPFLDRYNPMQGNPVGLVPRGPNATLLALPGLWEGTFWSYCLHAGMYQPGEGNGYAYAPLKGQRAQIIRHAA